ncbi:hypothetical protein E4U51_008557, partial [Claviceps purpurea]
MRDEERLKLSTGKRSTIGVNRSDAQSDIIDTSASERLRPNAKVQLLRRLPLLKCRLLRMLEKTCAHTIITSTQIRCHRTPAFVADPGEF